MPIPNIDAILAAGVIIGANRADTAVGLAWLKAHWREWDRAAFNVTMGPGAEVPAGAEDYVQQWVATTTTQRADIIVYSGNTAAIVELKQRIGGGALGQLLTYRYLLQIDNPALLQVYLIAAGTSIQAGITEFFRSQGVQVELFPLAVVSTT